MEKKIEGKDVLLINALPGEHKYNVTEESPMFGKTYKRYSFGGKVFTTNDDKFANAVENGDLDVVTLDVNEEGQYSLTGFITNKQAMNFARKTKQLAAIESLIIEPKKVTEEELAQLLN